MPEMKPDETEQEWMDRCIPSVLESGEAEHPRQAAAICAAKWEAKSLDAVKVGARNSAQDAERLQAIHDMAVANGAQCAPKSEIETYEIMSLDEVLVSAGGEIKAVSAGEHLVEVSGYLIRFGSPDDTDITPQRDFFTPQTDYGVKNWPATSHVYFNHRLPTKSGARLKKRLSHDAQLSMDNIGIIAKTLLDEREEYEAMLADMARAGKLGWSSGTAQHLTDRKTHPNGANEITAWSLGLDASLTHTPAEPRNVVTPLKSLVTLPDAGAAAAKNISPQERTMDDQELKTMITQAATEAARAAVDALAPAKSAGYVTVTKDESEQDFANAGEFLMAVKKAGINHANIDPRLKSRASQDSDGVTYEVRGIARNPFAPATKAALGMNEAIPSQGGYLVSSGLADGIIERMYADSGILSAVSKDPVGEGKNGMDYNALDETSRADGSRWGGLLGYWLAEAGTKQATKPKFRQMSLKLKKVAVLAYSTDEQLEDATNLASWLGRTVPMELRFKVEDAFFTGDGAGKPLGINGHASVVSVAKETNQAAATINYTNIVKMWSRLWVGSRSNAVWYINQDVEPQLDQLALAVGTGGIPANFITYGPDGVMRIKGRPVRAVEYCQTLGTVGDIILADLSQYQAIDKGGIQSASSIHVAFTTDETAFRWVYRVDGQPIWNAPLTPKNGTNTVSPFVTLATRS